MPGPGMDLINEDEIAAVVSLLKSGYLLRYGREDRTNFQARVFNLEREIAQRSGVNYAVGVNSGTSALLISLLSLGIGPGDEVIVPGYTFVASISAIIYAGAVPVLAEVDRSFNLDPADIIKKITERTKAIMVVHMLGNPACMDDITEIAKNHNIHVIEDCAQAFGATYRGRAIGSMGTLGAFSFNGFKTITAGDGGMLITNDENLYRRCFAIHDQGHLPNRMGVEIGARTVIGLDFRLTELQAAVLLAQLGKLDEMLARLRTNKAYYRTLLSDVSGLEFREIEDPQGEIATILVVIFPNEMIARQIASELGSKVVADSGWHVYNNMEHILSLNTVSSAHNPVKHAAYIDRGGHMEYRKGMLPQTDSLLERSMLISIGVTDPGLGAGFGVNILSNEADIEDSAKQFKQACKHYM